MATVAVDFDVPIHQYGQGWQDGSIYDRPTPGAVEAIRKLMGKHAVFVHTTRHATQVVPWLRDLGFDATSAMPTGPFWNRHGQLLVTNRKLPAHVYIDDRAIRFESWPQTFAELAMLLPGDPAG